MKVYKDALSKVNASKKLIPPARDKMPSVKFEPNVNMDIDFYDGFPILTGKTMPFYSIVGELVGFMKGVTDVREFDKLGTKVWWDNAYKWNVVDNPNMPPVTMEEYRANIVNDNYYSLGRIYSAQWRQYVGTDQNDDIRHRDQLQDMIDNIITTPYSRYHVMTAWNPIEMNVEQVSQPNCHVYFQASCVPIKQLAIATTKTYLRHFLTDESVDELFKNGYNPTEYLYTHLTQRSCDFFLGVPFNLTSYSLFSILLGIFTNTLPIAFNWLGVNSHIYSNHQEPVNDYLNKDTHILPRLDIRGIKSLADIEALNSLDDIKKHFKLVDYKSSGKVKAPLSVGL